MVRLLSDAQQFFVQISINVPTLSLFLKSFLHSDSEPKKTSKLRRRPRDICRNGANIGLQRDALTA